MLSTAASLSLPRMGARSRTVWPGHPAFRAVSSQPVRGVWYRGVSPGLPGWPGSCGGPGLLPSASGTSSAVEPCCPPDLGCAHLRAPIPWGPGRQGAGWSWLEQGGGVRAPPAQAHTLPAPQDCQEAGRAEQAHPGSRDCERASTGLCVLGPWGEGEGWSPAPEAMGPTRPSPDPSPGDATPHSQGCPGVGLGRVRLCHLLIFPRKDKQRELLPPCAGGFPRSSVTRAALL